MYFLNYKSRVSPRRRACFDDVTRRVPQRQAVRGASGHARVITFVTNSAFIVTD